MKIQNIISYLISITLLLSQRQFCLKYIYYKDYEKVYKIMKQFNQLVNFSGNDADLEFCAISDTYKYFHPEVLDDFIQHYYDQNPLKQASQYYIPNPEIVYNKNICVFQKLEQIIYYQLSDQCSIFTGIPFNIPNIEFSVFLFIATTDPIIVYLYEKVEVNQFMIKLSQFTNQFDKLEYKIKQFLIQLIESHYFPQNIKLSQLIQIDFEVLNKILRISQITKNIMRPELFNETYKINKKLMQRKYLQVRNLIEKKLHQPSQNLYVSLQQLIKDKPQNFANFQLLIDKSRIGLRVYDYIEPNCP